MANNYYTFSPSFVPGTRVRSDQVNTQYQAIETAFDRLPSSNTALVTGKATFGTAGGTANAITVALSDSRASDVNGDEVVFFAAATNTGAVTLNVDGNGARALRRADGSALAANDIQSGLLYVARYDNANTRWLLVGPSASYLTNAAASASAAAASASAAATSASNAATSESNAATSESNAADSAEAAEDWAIHPEDSLVPVSSGGNGVDEFSAYHWAQKAQGSSNVQAGSTDNSVLRWDAGSNLWVEEDRVLINASGDISFGTSDMGTLEEDGTVVRLRNNNDINQFGIVLEDTGTGGTVRTVFDGNAGGSSRLYHVGQVVFETSAAGGTFTQNAAGNSAIINVDDGDGERLQLAKLASGPARFTNSEHGFGFEFVAEDSGGVERTLLDSDPDGAVTLYRGGTRAFETSANGINVYHASSTTPEIQFYSSASVLQGELQVGGAGTELLSRVHGATVTLSGEDNGGVVRDLFVGDPDGAASLYFAGTAVLNTANNGIDIVNPSGNANLVLEDGDGETAQIVKTTIGALTIRNLEVSTELQLRGTDSGSGNVQFLAGDPDGPITLFHSGDNAARTAAQATVGGAAFEAHDGIDFYPVWAHRTARKTGATTRTNATSFSADPDMSLSLDAGNYRVEAFLLVQASGGSASDIEVGLAWSGSLNDSHGVTWWGPPTSTGATFNGTGIVGGAPLTSSPNAVDFGCRLSATSSHLVRCTAFFDANSTGTLAVWWTSASANDVTVHAQSRLIATRMEA